MADYQDFEDDFEDDSGASGSFVVAHKFLTLLARTTWFSRLGEPIEGELTALSEDYLAGLGFPDACVAAVGNWQDAALVAANPEIDSPWWEAEDQSRLGLSAAACDVFPEQEVADALRLIHEQGIEFLVNASIDAGLYEQAGDDALLRAIQGSALKSCQDALLILLSGSDQDHPLAVKFRLFETGRWPIGITGSTFNLF